MGRRDIDGRAPPGAGQLPVDIDHHTRIASPRAQLIGGNQMLDGGL
jgi:hypothetical protein